MRVKLNMACNNSLVLFESPYLIEEVSKITDITNLIKEVFN